MTDQDPYAIFRPVSGRIVPIVVGLLCIGVFTTLAFVLPSGGGARSSGADRLLVMAIGLLLAAAMWRFAQVRAIPNERGLEVHNLLVSRTVTWQEVVEVQFGGGSPWAVLELDDFSTLAVMGIQRSDGPRAQDQAERLAALVAGHQGKHAKGPIEPA